MKLGEVIRKYRKEKQMTQEEMANYLGVTAPAVNKWENGKSYPDISLLAPIARLLGIQTDTLLSYQEDLEDKEIDRIIEQIRNRINKEDYEEIFQWSINKTQEYPNCDKLILYIAQVLDAYRILIQVPNFEKYKNTIMELYKRLLNSTDPDTVQTALISLVTNYLMLRDYEQAQKYLSRIPKPGINPNKYQAILYQKQGKVNEAYELFERLLFDSYGDISWALQGINGLAMEEGDLSKAERIVEKQKELAKIFEMGTYREVSPDLELAMLRKDKEACFDILGKMIHSLNDMDAFRHSELYSHMEFSTSRMNHIASMLKKGFQEDDTIAFLKEDDRYKELMDALEGLSME